MSESDITEEEQRNAIITTITLDISSKHLKEVPKTIKNFSNIEFLYLCTNDIKSIPDHFFTSLPQLKWLDFRHNLLTALPTSIGEHRQLRTLLLQGNQLATLPVELGNVPTLTGLNIADNPIEYPPKTVLQEGTQEILKYLRLELQSESLLIPELIDALEEVHITENEGYLGRKISSSKNHNISPQKPPTWELSYLPSDPPPSSTAPRLSSPSRLGMPRRARSQASIMRMRGAVRSPSPDRPLSPDRPVRNQRPIPRRPESTGRLFEFVPMIKPKKSSARCTNINNDTRSRNSDLGFPTHDLYVQPRPKTSFETLPNPSNSRSLARNSRGNVFHSNVNGYDKNGNGFQSRNGNGFIHNGNGFKSSGSKHVVNNGNGINNQYNNAWSDSHVIRRSM